MMVILSEAKYLDLYHKIDSSLPTSGRQVAQSDNNTRIQKSQDMNNYQNLFKVLNKDLTKLYQNFYNWGKEVKYLFLKNSVLCYYNNSGFGNCKFFLISFRVESNFVTFRNYYIFIYYCSFNTYMSSNITIVHYN